MISKKMSFGLSPILKTSEPDPKNLLNKIRKNFIPTNQKSVESLKTTTPDMNKRNPLYTSIKKSIEDEKLVDKFNEKELQKSVENIKNVGPNYTRVGDVRGKIKNPQWWHKDTKYVDNTEVDNAKILSEYYSDDRTQAKLAGNIETHNTNPSYRPLGRGGFGLYTVNTDDPMVNREEAGFNKYTQIMANNAILNGLKSKVIEPIKSDKQAVWNLGSSEGQTYGGGSSVVRDVNNLGAAAHEMTHNMSIRSPQIYKDDFKPGPFTKPKVNPETGEVENVVASQYKGENLKSPFNPDIVGPNDRFLHPEFNKSENSWVRNNTMRADYAGNTSDRFQFDDLQGQLMMGITDDMMDKGKHTYGNMISTGATDDTSAYMKHSFQPGAGQEQGVKRVKAGKEYYAHLQGAKTDILSQGDPEIIEALMDSKVTPEMLDKLRKKDGFKSTNLENFKQTNHSSEHIARFLNEVAYDTSDQFVETNNNVA